MMNSNSETTESNSVNSANGSDTNYVPSSLGSTDNSEIGIQYLRDNGSHTSGHTREHWGIDSNATFPLYNPQANNQPYARRLAYILERECRVNGRTTVNGRSFA